MNIRIESLEKKLYKYNFSIFNFAHFSLSLILLYFIYNFKYNRNENNIDFTIIFVTYIFYLFFIKKTCDEKNKIISNYLIIGALFPTICSVFLLFSPANKLEINIIKIKSEEDLLLELRKYKSKLESKNQIYNATLISKVIIDNITSHNKLDIEEYEKMKNILGEIPEYKIYKTEEIPVFQ